MLQKFRAATARLSSNSQSLSFAVGLVGAMAVLGWHVRSVYPFMADDAFISLRYSQRLLSGDGLTWDDAERVEGYSNLTWILGCAALGSVGVDLVTSARILGLLSSASVWAALLAVFRPTWVGMLPGQAAVWGLALCSPFAVWSIGGLEQPLVAALCAWLVALLGYPERFSRVSIIVPCVLCALLTWTRPDGVFLCGLIAVSVTASDGACQVRFRRASLLIGAALLAYAMQLAFRLVYYDDWIPNPARIKVAWSLQRLVQGWGYVADAMAALSPQFLAIAWVTVLLFSRRCRNRPTVMVATLCGGWMLYVCFIGGDIFPARRHAVLVVVLGAFAVAELVQRLSALTNVRMTAGVVMGYLVVLGVGQSRDVQADVARAERWEWDGEVVGRLLDAAFGEKQPLLAVDPAGCLPFFSQLPSLDMLGLNDRHIARNRPRDLGKGKLAHEFGDGRYVLSRKPDLALFCLPRGSDRACFRSAAEMLSQPEFHRDFRLLGFLGKEPHTFHSRIWVRVESEKIGIQRRPDQIVVPGYLFADAAVATAQLDESRRLVTALAPSTTTKLRITIPAGNYTLTLRAVGAATASATKGFRPDANGGGTLELRRETQLDLVVSASEAAFVEELVLSKKRSD